jgi:D-3-phosphoglycerate dehydrogenase
MRALILAPFAQESLAALREAGIEPVHESWLDAGELQDPEELGARIAREDFDAAIVEADFLLAETFNAAPGLRFGGICRAALNQVDVEAATESGIVVVNTPGRNAGAVAEMTMALMLAVARRVAEADRYVRGGKWESPVGPYNDLRGSELGGKTVGIVGLGAIGRRVAELCNAFGMNVLAYDPFVTPAQADRLKATWTELDFMLEVADFVTLHAPTAEDGPPLLNAARISRMKRGAALVNTAAAELVDQDALADALSAGKLSGAGLDIFPTHPVEPSYPLLGMPNVVMTPHIGGATEDTVARHSAMMAEDLIRFARGERPHNLVNPEVWERRRVPKAT